MRDTIITWNGNPYPFENVLQGVGPGWKDVVTRLIDDLFELGWDGQLFQIKEKFGGLRFYTGACTDAMYARIAQAESESYVTCEYCSAPGQARHDGWIKVMCDDCHSKSGRKGD